MQLLIQTNAPDYASWKAGFDAGAEAIATAGLSVLQIWRAEGGDAVLVLFEVSNRDRAGAWLENQTALGHGYSAQFLNTI